MLLSTMHCSLLHLQGRLPFLSCLSSTLLPVFWCKWSQLACPRGMPFLQQHAFEACQLLLHLHKHPAVLIIVDKENIAAYTAATLDDPRTANKILYIAPPTNSFWSQNELIKLYEKLSGKQVERHDVSSDDLQQRIAGRLPQAYRMQ